MFYMFDFWKNWSKKNEDRQSTTHHSSSATREGSRFPSIRTSRPESAEEGTRPRIADIPRAINPFPLTGWKKAFGIGVHNGVWGFIPVSARALFYPAELSRFVCNGHGDLTRFVRDGVNLNFCTDLSVYPGTPCGFYSVKNRNYLKEDYMVPLTTELEVDLFGKVIEYEKVYRSEYQRVLAAHVSAECFLHGPYNTQVPCKINDIGGGLFGGNDIPFKVTRHRLQEVSLIRWICTNHLKFMRSFGDPYAFYFGNKMQTFSAEEIRDNLGIELYINGTRV